MFTPSPAPQPQPRALQDLRTAQEGERTRAQAHALRERFLSFAEQGALARAGYLQRAERLFTALAEVSTCGDHLERVGEVQEVAHAPAYVREAVRIVRGEEQVIGAALAVYVAFQEDPDQASAPAADERRHAALLAAERSDAFQRPLVEMIRLFKLLNLPPTDWTVPRLQALPLIWSRQGVQPQRAWESLVAFMVMTWLAQEPMRPAWLATAIARIAEAAPTVHAEILAKAERAAKAAHEEHIASFGLGPEAVFALLETPIGPVRGHVMAAVRLLLQNPEDQTVDLGPHTATLRDRARAAHNAHNL